MGATPIWNEVREDEEVSIHAPVMGATNWDAFICTVVLVSIHAPVMGATPERCEKFCRQDSFNPRPRDGGDG